MPRATANGASRIPQARHNDTIRPLWPPYSKALLCSSTTSSSGVYTGGPLYVDRAGDAIRTRDNLLGRQELCQLSYARTVGVRGLEPPTSASQTLRATRLRYTPATSV